MKTNYSDAFVEQAIIKLLSRESARLSPLPRS
ncbi:hypothetical protein H4V98_002107 [Polaromonas sp. CG_23.6]|nr:hypothetical protein [Polaromonas sp. CG_23.6]